MINLHSLVLTGLVLSLNEWVCIESDTGVGYRWCPELYHAIRTSNNTVCLRYFNESQPWHNASNTCKQEHATLLQFEHGNTEEQIDLFKHGLVATNQNPLVWIALRRVNEHYQWVGSAPRRLKSSSTIPKPPWGSTWDRNEPRIWDGCAALNMSSGRMIAQNCTNTNVAFMCERKVLSVVYCDAASGWFGRKGSKRCSQAGSRETTWEEAQEACCAENGCTIPVSDLELPRYFHFIIRVTSTDGAPFLKYQLCEDGSDDECSKSQPVFFCSTPNIERNVVVRLTLTGYHNRSSAIWITNATKAILRCDVSVEGNQVSKTQEKSIQYSWLKNGVYLETAYNATVIPEDLASKGQWPVDEEHRLPLVLGTFQCKVRLPGFRDNYSSNVLSIYLQDFLMFLYTITMEVGKTTELPDLEPTSCNTSQAMRLAANVSNILKKVLPLKSPRIDGFRWFIHSVRPRMVTAWEQLTRKSVIFKVYVGVVIASDAATNINHTLKILRTSAAVNESIEIEALESCGDRVIPIGETKYSLQMLPRKLKTYSVPSCITNDSKGKQLPSICQLSYVDGPQWDLADYASCLTNRSQTSSCLQENTTIKNNETLTWPHTSIGRTALPLQLCMTANGMSVTRQCLNSSQNVAFWGPVTGSCEALVSNTTKSLQKLSQSNITKESTEKSADDLYQLTKNASQLQPIDVDYIGATMEKIAETGNVSTETLCNVASTVDYLMNVIETEKFNEAQSFSRITQSLEMSLSTADLGDSHAFNLSLNSLILAAQILTAETDASKLVVGLEFLQEETFNSSQVFTITEGTEINSTRTEAAVILPLEFVKNRTKHANVTRLSFIMYKNTSMFTNVQMTRTSRIITRVVAASLTGHPVMNLASPVELLFRPLEPVRPLNKVLCVWNDNSSGHGHWSDAGCWLNASHDDVIICHCNHLTNFAVLMDVYGQDERVTGHHKFALDIITYVGCSLSILGLTATILMFLKIKNLRKNNGCRVICNLAASLLGLLVVFVAGIRQTDWPDLCLAVAALLHYFLLASFCWMLVEAVHQYLRFVRVFNTYVPRFILKTMLFAWGTPLVFVTIVLAIDANMYRGGSHYCWMSLDAVYYTVLPPIGIVMAMNVIVFILVIKGITCSRSKALRSNQSNRKQAMIRLNASACIFVLLGLTWIFGFMAISSARIIFQYLFCIFNSFQGFLIFLFMIVKERNSKELWCLFCFQKRATNSGLTKSTCKKKNRPNIAEHSFSRNDSLSTRLVENSQSSATTSSDARYQ